MKENNIQMLLDRIAAEWNYNGTVCVTVGGKRVAFGAYGLYDREKGLAFSNDTGCYVASVTKQFTAVCTLMLEEEGILNIDDKLSAYLPEYSHSDEMTLRQLLNMTSGIRHELSVLGEKAEAEAKKLGLKGTDADVYITKACAPIKCGYEDFLGLVNPLPLLFTPGERFDYSDTNYMMLGHIIENISGLPLAEFMKERIFMPLGMKQTVVGADYSAGPSYMYADGKEINLGKAHFTTGEGSIVTTANDLCLWLNGVLDGKFLNDKHRAECFELVNGYGFGWMKSGEWFAHGGGDLGYEAHVFIHSQARVAVAMTANERLRTSDGKSGSEFCDKLLGEILS